MTTVPTSVPFERIAMDILDTRKISSQGFQYILVMSDYFSKYTDAFGSRRHTGSAVADILLRRWIVYDSVPKELHFDRGAELEGILIKRQSELLEMEKIRTTHSPTDRWNV